MTCESQKIVEERRKIIEASLASFAARARVLILDGPCSLSITHRSSPFHWNRRNKQTKQQYGFLKHEIATSTASFHDKRECCCASTRGHNRCRRWTINLPPAIAISIAIIIINISYYSTSSTSHVHGNENKGFGTCHQEWYYYIR